MGGCGSERRGKFERFAVDAGKCGARARSDLELGRGELPPELAARRAGRSRVAVSSRAASEPVLVVTANTPSSPRSSRRRCALSGDVPITYGLFETITRIAPSTSSPSGVVNWRSNGSDCRPSICGSRRLRRVDLRVAVRVLLHDLRVDAERDVVHEEPAVDGREVDRALDRVAERVHRLRGDRRG